jgi:hypothetical protein
VIVGRRRSNPKKSGFLMPSDALLAWQTVRMPRLQAVEDDCLHLESLHAANPSRAQEYIRSYAVLLSAEFQGFCRELYDECAEKLVESVTPASLQAVLRSQFGYRRSLRAGNPNSETLKADFNRFQFEFWATVLAADATHAARKGKLEELAAWRNAIAHYDYDLANLGGSMTLTISQVHDWGLACDGLAAVFDSVLRDFLHRTTGVAPWAP